MMLPQRFPSHSAVVPAVDGPLERNRVGSEVLREKHAQKMLKPQLKGKSSAMKRTILTAQHDNGDMVAGENFKRQLLTTLTAVRNGDFSSRLPSDLTGLDGKVADAFNEVVGRMERFGEGVSRLRNEVGRRGRISERLSMGDSIGGWAERIESINSLVDDLSQPTVEIRERQKLEALVLNISEREQQRIGQDLHDGLCQQLTGIKFRNRLLAQKLAEHGSPEVRDAQEIEKLLIDAIEQARNQALGLLPVRLEAEGLRTALQELAASITCFFGVECVCTFPDPVSIQDHGVAIHFYRIAQEAITNAIKHGRREKLKSGLWRAMATSSFRFMTTAPVFLRCPRLTAWACTS